MSTEVRHILSLSGGKDSAALAIHMRDRVPQMEYVFCDTNKELPETYDYLNQIEAYLSKKIIRIEAARGFDHWLTLFQGYLPSVQVRWCTSYLKLKPFEDYVGNQPVVNYVGLRCDEDRDARISKGFTRLSADPLGSHRRPSFGISRLGFLPHRFPIGESPAPSWS